MAIFTAELDFLLRALTFEAVFPMSVTSGGPRARVFSESLEGVRWRSDDLRGTSVPVHTCAASTLASPKRDFSDGQRHLASVCAVERGT
eukprot:scaffold249311_cov31-Tisochrysis_lutea.AAC.1